MPTTNNILVIGGTGKTGKRVVKKLSQAGHTVRIGSRNANPKFDWEDRHSWAKALNGMNKVYITFQPDLAVPGALESIEHLVKTANEQGIKKLVLLSGKGEKEAELCEQVIINSGLDYTIVRASWFMQNFSESFFLDPIIAGHVALPKPKAQVPYVDANDIAEVAVAALIDDKHNGQIYELTGPETLTFEEVTSAIAKATGRTIPFTVISLDAYIQMLKGLGVPPDYIWLINYLFTEVLDAENNNIVTNDVEKVLGRKPRSFSSFAAETTFSGIWNASEVQTF